MEGQNVSTTNECSQLSSRNRLLSSHSKDLRIFYDTERTEYDLETSYFESDEIVPIFYVRCLIGAVSGSVFCSLDGPRIFAFTVF